MIRTSPGLCLYLRCCKLSGMSLFPLLDRKKIREKQFHTHSSSGLALSVFLSKFTRITTKASSCPVTTFTKNRNEHGYLGKNKFSLFFTTRLHACPCISTPSPYAPVYLVTLVEGLLIFFPFVYVNHTHEMTLKKHVHVRTKDAKLCVGGGEV